METIGCTETSETNYPSTLCKIPKERRSTSEGITKFTSYFFFRYFW